MRSGVAAREGWENNGVDIKNRLERARVIIP